MDVHGVKFYGSTTVGTKGQMVLPAKLRKELKISAGDKLVVLVHQMAPTPTVLIVKSMDLTKIIQRIFGEGNLQKIMQTEKTQSRKKK